MRSRQIQTKELKGRDRFENIFDKIIYLFMMKVKRFTFSHLISFFVSIIRSTTITNNCVNIFYNKVDCVFE